MKKKYGIAIISIVIMAVIVVFYHTHRGTPALISNPQGNRVSSEAFSPQYWENIPIHAPGGIINAAIASSSAAQERGLGGRMSLPADQGMLFIFSEAHEYGFWMKDMHFPIDMVWINGNKKVVGVTPDVFPQTYPNTFLPPSPVLYVLEINSGSARKFGIATGTVLSF